ncbi:hypothetical protein BDQ17DRAFT_631437 [Cyathus striatus]|nr:hypothetical protein BDQ17DRAFT_631437 [Cyathus striatus]
MKPIAIVSVALIVIIRLAAIPFTSISLKPTRHLEYPPTPHLPILILNPASYQPQHIVHLTYAHQIKYSYAGPTLSDGHNLQECFRGSESRLTMDTMEGQGQRSIGRINKAVWWVFGGVRDNGEDEE